MRTDELTEMLRDAAAELPVDDHPDIDLIADRGRSARRRRRALTITLAAAAALGIGLGYGAVARHNSSTENVHTAATGATTVPRATNPATSMSVSTAPPTTVRMPCAPKSAQNPSDYDSPGYVGLTLEQAQTLAAQQGHPLEVIDRDGKHIPHTLERVTGRINVVINNNVVTQACHE